MTSIFVIATFIFLWWAADAGTKPANRSKPEIDDYSF